MGFAWPGGIDRTNNYRCAYAWGSGYAPSVPAAQKAYWDIGYSLVVDRWEVGCGMTVTGPQYGAGVPAGGANGDIYYRQGTGVAAGGANTNCYLKSGGVWTAFSNGGMTDAMRTSLATNSPGYAPIISDQMKAYGTCANRNEVGVGSLRLPRMHEDIAMKAWNGIFNNPSAVQVGNYHTGNNHPVNFSCNTNHGNGLLVANNVFFPTQYYVMIAGSDATKNCKSRYDIQDPSGNTSHWTSDQFTGTSGCVTGTCTGSVSALDTNSKLLDGLLLDNSTASIPCNNCGSGSSAFSIPMLGVYTPNATAAVGSRANAAIVAPGTFGIYNMSITPGPIVGVLDTGVSAANGGRISHMYNSPAAFSSGGYSLNGFRCVGQVGP